MIKGKMLALVAVMALALGGCVSFGGTKTADTASVGRAATGDELKTCSAHPTNDRTFLAAPAGTVGPDINFVDVGGMIFGRRPVDLGPCVPDLWPPMAAMVGRSVLDMRGIAAFPYKWEKPMDSFGKTMPERLIPGFDKATANPRVDHAFHLVQVGPWVGCDRSRDAIGKGAKGKVRFRERKVAVAVIHTESVDGVIVRVSMYQGDVRATWRKFDQGDGIWQGGGLQLAVFDDRMEASSITKDRLGELVRTGKVSATDAAMIYQDFIRGE